MLTRGLFITGTDTGVGKTWVSALIMSVLKDLSSSVYFKPVQTGFEEDDDTTTVEKLAGLNEGQVCIPVYRLKAPMSPDRAAALENTVIDPRRILDMLDNLSDSFVVVEGAGGLEVPLNSEWRTSRLIKAMDFPVVVVASTRLGTINHTILTVEKARALGLNVLGVVLNGPAETGTPDLLSDLLAREGIPVLFHLPMVEAPTKIAEFAALSSQIIELKKKAEAHFVFKSDATQKDRAYVWHPFTQHKTEPEFPVVKSGSGSVLRFENGVEAIDGISSWWVNLHGHSEPRIAAAIGAQAAKLEHAVFAGYTHVPAVELAERLVKKAQAANPHIQRAFYSDNGSTAVEVALKMAYQWHQQKGETGRTHFLALKGSYHGDTFGAMSVSEREGYHTVFQPLMAPVDFVTPDDFSELEELKSELKKYAACIVEPLIQGAGGMRLYSAAYLQRLAKICKDNDVLLIADEVFTGFHRTGAFLASEKAQVSPDLICLSKGISGGFLPLAVTLATESLFEAFKDDGMARAFLHGHSYTANPIACAAATTSLDLLEMATCQKRIAELERWTEEGLKTLADNPVVLNPRRLGTIGAFDVKGHNGYFSGDFPRRFAKACFDRGVLLRPLGGAVYTVPPYSTTETQMREIYRVSNEVLWTLQRG